MDKCSSVLVCVRLENSKSVYEQYSKETESWVFKAVLN